METELYLSLSLSGKDILHVYYTSERVAGRFPCVSQYQIFSC